MSVSSSDVGMKWCGITLVAVLISLYPKVCAVLLTIVLLTVVVSSQGARYIGIILVWADGVPYGGALSNHLMAFMIILRRWGCAADMPDVPKALGLGHVFCPQEEDFHSPTLSGVHKERLDNAKQIMKPCRSVSRERVHTWLLRVYEKNRHMYTKLVIEKL